MKSIVLLLLLTSPALAKTEFIAVPTPKGVYLRWTLPPALANKEIRIYRKRPDRAKARLINRQKLQRVSNEDELREALGKTLARITRKMPGTTGSVKDREKQFFELFFKGDDVVEIASFFYPRVATALAVSYFDNKVVIPKKYRYRLVVITGGREKTVAEKTIRSDRFPRVPTPKKLKAELMGKGIRLSWSPVRNADVLGYFIYRSKEKSRGFIRQNEMPLAYFENEKNKNPVVNFIDDKVKSGIQYYYQVTAVHFSGMESKATKPLEIRAFDQSRPKPVTVIKATLRKDGLVYVFWKASSQKNLAHYNIYASLGKKQTFIKVNEVPVPPNVSFFQHEPGKVGTLIRYRVTAVNTKNIESQPSASVSCYLKRMSAPERIGGVKAIAGESLITIKWQRARDKNIDYYEVHRAESKDGKFFSRGRVPKKKTFYTDRDVRGGPTYYYKVAYRDQFSSLSSFSQIVHAQVKDLRPPLAPVGLRVHVIENKARLSWSAIMSPQLKGFFIYRQKKGSKRAHRLNAQPLPPDRENYTAALPDRASYVFFIKAVSRNDVLSKKSAVVYAKPWARALPAPSLRSVLATRSKRASALAIHWDYAQPNTSGFMVYKKATAEKHFYKLSAKPLPANAKSFTDRNVKPGRRYQYYVVAIDRGGKESKKSKIMSNSVGEPQE